MSNKILPICKNPPIKTYHHHAFTLGILLADNKDIKPWYYSNYIQLIYEEKNFCQLNFLTDCCFYTSVLFQKQIISKQTLRKYDLRSAEFLRDAIRDGFYICAIVNEYYIPHKNAYHNYNNLHDICIYGYSDYMFNIIGYNKYGVYAEDTVSFSAIENSDPDFIYLLKAKPENQYILDLPLICDGLTRYLKPENIAYVKQASPVDYNKKYFGINAYCFFSDHFEILKERPEKADVRAFELLREHKQCMLNRLIYLNENRIADLNNQISNYQNIFNQTKKVKLVFMKYIVRKDAGMLPTILDEIMAIRDYEKAVLSEVLSILKDKL